MSSSADQTAWPASTGLNTSSRNTPAFTIAAACRYAETGEMATMESGSQDWNGNWADFVKAATARSTASTVLSVGSCQIPLSSTPLRDAVPVVATMVATAASRASPPPTVTSSVRIAGSRAWSPERPMRKKEAKEVNSHATNRTTRLSASTSRSMEAANAVMRR